VSDIGSDDLSARGLQRRERRGLMSLSSTDTVPWVSQDATRGLVLVALGIIGLAFCWWGASGEANWHHQYGWLGGAIASTALAAVGVTGWLLAGFRNVRLAKRELFTELRAQGLLDDDDDVTDGGTTTTTTTTITSTTTAPPAGSLTMVEYVASPSMSRFHRPGCPLIARKPEVDVVSPAEIHRRGLQACGMCIR
jgi:hypothetical protein